MSVTLDVNRLCMGCMRLRPDENPVCPYCGAHAEQLQNTPHQLTIFSILKGQYLVGKSLGQGGFGITYIGYDLVLDMRVAIKEYYPEGFVCRQATLQNSQVLSYTGHKKDQFLQGREAFLTEARVLAKLGALPHVVHVRDFFQSNGTAYIVMEYVEGETLKKRLARNGDKLPAAEVLDLLRPVMKSLGKIHEMGLLHRDISPDNIIIRENGDAVLLDFGAAVDMDDAMQHSIALNVKHGYAPVEQYTQHSNLGPWSDVYAMSATIYRALTGKIPPQSIERASGGSAIKSPNSLGAGLTSRQEKALVQGLSIYAKDRIQSMEELSNRLSATPVKDTDGGGAGKSKKGLVIGLVCAGVAVAAGALVVLQPWKGADVPVMASEPTAAVMAAAPTETVYITDAPTPVVTLTPTAEPTQVPTPVPTQVPTEIPTVPPTAPPTAVPAVAATPVPTEVPTPVPTEIPTQVPTQAPTATPEPTAEPTPVPTEEPTWRDGNGTSYAVLDGLGYDYIMANLEGHSSAKLEIYISEKDGGVLVAGYNGQLPADGAVVLPDTVRINNMDYPIIALCDDFMKGQSGLTALYLPDSLEYISPLPYQALGQVTICGNPGTLAERFAAEMGLAFRPMRYPPQATATPTPEPTPEPTFTPTPAPTYSAEATPEINAQQYLEYEAVDGGLRLVNYFGPDKVLEIPAEWNGKPVVEVALRDSDSVKALEKLIIPEGVLTLGDCLKDCPHLAQVELPRSLQWMDPRALMNTPWMEAAVAAAHEGDGLVMAGETYVLRYVGQAEEVILPDHVMVVGEGAFAGTNLRSFKGGAGLTTVHSGALANMVHLEALSLPSGVTGLANDALAGTNNLRMLSLDCMLNHPIHWEEGQLSQVKLIYLGASATLEQLGGLTGRSGSAAFVAPGHPQTELLRQAGFTVIGSATQQRSEKAMHEMGWPAIMEPGKAVIGFTWDYEYCEADGTARLVKYLGSDNSKELEIPAAVSHGGRQYTVTELADNMLSGYKKLEKVVLPAGLVRVGAGAFSGCTNLRTLQFSGARVVIEPGAFADTKLFNNKKELLDDQGRLVMARGSGTIKVSADVQEIAPYAFSGTAFDTVNLPEGLRTIGDFAFADMPKLKKLTLPQGAQTIGHFAFARTALEQLHLPQGASRLGCGLMADTSATLYGTQEQIDPLAQDGYPVSSQEQVEEKGFVFVLDYTTHTAALQQITVRSDTVTIPKAVREMPVTRILSGCGNGATFGKVNIPGTVAEPLQDCFNDMPNLYGLQMEEGCAGFDGTSFLNCPRLKTVQLPASVWQLPAQAPGAKDANFQLVRNSYAHTWAESLGLKVNLRNK